MTTSTFNEVGVSITTIAINIRDMDGHLHLQSAEDVHHELKLYRVMDGHYDIRRDQDCTTSLAIYIYIYT